ncbi:MAG: exodeoxyribonuclease VII small subunit [Chlamydiales bacterium]|nr:exodeoxyribonuclease VII small subunit [Chlamydiales bacterium]NCF70516.1 exodeoxyribonuclease VII small subunit [Chlamydiales bacterium]
MSSKSSSKSLNFEQSFERLEKILEEMNNGSLSLEDSIKHFEEADKLIKNCDLQLNEAEKKIEKLIKNRNGDLEKNEQGEVLSEKL